MPVEAQYNTRFGGPKMLELAQTLCRIVNELGPVARVVWSDRSAFIAWLDAAQGMCSLIIAANDERVAEDSMTALEFDPPDA